MGHVAIKGEEAREREREREAWNFAHRPCRTASQGPHKHSCWAVQDAVSVRVAARARPCLKSTDGMKRVRLLLQVFVTLDQLKPSYIHLQITELPLGTQYQELIVERSQSWRETRDIRAKAAFGLSICLQMQIATER